MTERRPLDFYPTPAPVGAVVRDWLARQDLDDSPWLDPAAGSGDLIRSVRDCDELGEKFWHAIELNPEHESALEDVAEDITIADALATRWPTAHIVANPPFALLDEFWQQITGIGGVYAAVLTPVAWWNAEKRAIYRRPDHMIALGWRPVFHAKAGAAHKGSQDFVWSIIRPEATRNTTWERVEKPVARTSTRSDGGRS